VYWQVYLYGNQLHKPSRAGAMFGCL
jgi:hypothetical protein